jgi:GNAT superfamily N-acetyltransferase
MADTEFIITEITQEADVRRAHAVMVELRPHIADEEVFVRRVQEQFRTGYRLAILESAGQVRSAAGFRVMENLAWGRHLYVDDLVTRATDHGAGFGSRLFDWLLDLAKKEDCGQFHLDSGVQRHGAHRFYLHKGMDITAHHFALNLH